MRLGLRMLFVVMLIQGIAAFFVLRVFGQEVKPSVGEAIEAQLVDLASLLAEVAAMEMQTGTLQVGGFAQAVSAYKRREVNAVIWGFRKDTLDLDVYATDARGIVVYDSQGGALGQDFSQWRDVKLTLEGRYGARTSAIQGYLPGSGSSTGANTMYVAAPIKKDGQVLGVLTVSQPQAKVQALVDRAQRRVLVSGLWMLALSSAIGVAVTLWVVWHVRRLRAYAQSVQFEGAEAHLPDAPGELGDLADALGGMRKRLDGRDYVHGYLQALTHELKSPIAAVVAGAELLQDDLPEADRKQFAKDIADQSQRMKRLVDRMLDLARLEQGSALQLQSVNLGDLLQEIRVTCLQPSSAASLRGIDLSLHVGEPATWQTEPSLLRMALRNVIDNAIDFSPDGGQVSLATSANEVTVTDLGPGVPEYAMARLGERFFTTPRPDGARSGTGLGLAISRRIGEQLGFELHFENLNLGFRVRLRQTV